MLHRGASLLMGRLEASETLNVETTRYKTTAHSDYYYNYIPSYCAPRLHVLMTRSAFSLGWVRTAFGFPLLRVASCMDDQPSAIPSSRSRR